MSAANRPRHAPMDQFGTESGELVIGGLGVQRLSTRIGGTPFYAYDRGLLSGRIDALRAALPRGLQLHYAVKANPMPAVVDLLAQHVDGMDIASAGELAVALNAGVAPANISFAGPGKRDEELIQAIASGVRLHAESLGELERIGRIQRDTGWPARIALRINPDFELKSAGMRMGGGAKPFGIDVEALPTALELVRRHALKWEGLHIFAGSQNLKAEAIVEAQQLSWQLVLAHLEQLPPGTRSINLGGGFGIPYFPGEKHLDLAPIAKNLAQIQDQAAQALPGAKIEIELGRYLTGSAGVYVCRVVERKSSRGKIFLITDGGMHHHLPASGNFGQVLRKNYPVAIANRMEANLPLETVTITGPLCTPLDVLADQVELPRADVGDFVAVFQSGAYGASASPQAFLGHPEVREALV